MPANHQATTTNSNNTTTGKPKITPNATKGLGKGTDEQTGEGRWCLIISPPVLVLCLAEATGSGGAGWSSWHYQVDHPIARRRARARHARVTHSTGRARSCRAQRSRRCAGMALGVRDHAVARSRSRATARLTTLALTSLVACVVSRYTLPFLRGAPLTLISSRA